MRVFRLTAGMWLITTLPAAVVHIDIASTDPVAGGRQFGKSGAYERLKGKARLAVDPNHPANKVIAHLQLAPRNAQGLIEFSADLYVLRPRELAKGNATILFEVVNRGKKGMLGMFNRAREDDFGDGLLLNEGYTLVWVGWQHDVPLDPELMRVYVPSANIKGLVRSEFAPDSPVQKIPLGDAGHVAYPVLNPETARVTVRDDIYGPRTELAKDAWSLNGDTLRLSSPATPGRLYEIVYESSDPPVAGLGLAAIRDVISHLKKEYKYAIGVGTSQSAMVLKALLYEGFNQDEKGAMVFDGIFAHVAGGRRSTFQRFTQPSRTAGPLRNASLSTTEQFPFADLPQVDPVTRQREGILRQAEASRTVPKIFYTNSSYEYWGSAASLTHTTVDGRSDAPPPPTTRVYMFAGGQHGPAAFPPQEGRGRNLANFNDYRWPMRALLKRLQQWVANGTEPPPSDYPNIKAATLVPLAKYRFVAIPEIEVPKIIHTPHRLDFTAEPPKVLAPFVPLVPQADKDGNDAAGIRMPELACAIGTFTGWNLRHPRISAPKYLLGNTGSYIPFPRTPAEGESSKDPRPSIVERYATEQAYTECVERRANEMVAKGLLLREDVAPIVNQASRHWHWRMARPTTTTWIQRSRETEQRQ
jgi:hypothetical protein